MWYISNGLQSTCYATSADGIHWRKPILDVVPGTNIVLEQGRDSGTIWLDSNEKDAGKRFKMFLYNYDAEGRHHKKLTVHYSPDGIHWTGPVHIAGPAGDRTTVFFNPFRNKWVYGIRDGYGPLGRIRRYHEGPDPLTAGTWTDYENEPFWVGGDRLDEPIPGLNVGQPQLYNLDCAAYESIVLGLFSVWKGPQNNEVTDRPKLNEIYIGYSRDGFHWSRPLRRPFIGVSENRDDWNYGNIQSAGGCCLVVGDSLYFYYSGRTSDPARNIKDIGSTGLAFLRRDGFASMDAGETTGMLTTRPVKFSGSYLFVNTNTAAGELRVEVLDEEGNTIAPFTETDCIPVRKNSTAAQVRWKKHSDLSSISDKPVRFRFHLTNGSLYSFWVSGNKKGVSRGYTAAGGPGFNGPADTEN